MKIYLITYFDKRVNKTLVSHGQKENGDNVPLPNDPIEEFGKIEVDSGGMYFIQFMK